MTDLRYPIGPYKPENAVSRSEALLQMRALPSELRAAVAGLSEAQLDTPYRPEGWTVRQVVHHLADSQMHWYIRTKLALTEANPTIKPYDEQPWSVLADAQANPVEDSLNILDGLYVRW